jgi:hypothetical protein
MPQVPLALNGADRKAAGSDTTEEGPAPSRQDLLQRAATLGPARMTWESVVLQPSDPILGAKMQPRVAARRARFRTIVKVTLGACLAFCVAAAAASGIPMSDRSNESAAPTPKTSPATGIVPVETLVVARRTKAVSTFKAVSRATTAARVPKRR